MTRLFDSGDLPETAKRIVEGIRASGQFDGGSEEDRQIFAIAEECGEVVKAYRRWTGQSRLSGTREEVEVEIADVIITAYATAYVFNVDINTVIARKLHEIFHRGWKGPSHDVST